MDQEKLILSLIERGWYSCENFLTLVECQELINELQSLPLKTAQVGKGPQKLEVLEIRNDSIFWLDSSRESDVQNIYLTKMDQLMSVINRELYLGLKQFEGHFARYDKNGFYRKHIDQFSSNHERKISVISYLNTPIHGGELRIYSKENPDIVEVDIPAKTGSLVCFLSNQIYHEVRPTESERFSIAGWLRTTIL